VKKNIKDLQIRLKKNNTFGDVIYYSAIIEYIINTIQKENPELNLIDIKRVIDAELRMLKQVMNNEGLITPESKFEDFKSIRLFRLGSFRPSPGKFKHIQEKLKNV